MQKSRSEGPDSISNALLSMWMWFEIGLVSLLGFVVQVPLALITWPFDRRKALTGRWFRNVGVLSSVLSPFWNFKVVGPIPEKLPGRTVVVGNHESQADPFLISYLPWEMKWLSKASLFRIPVIGWSMWLAGDIPVRRGTADSTRAAMARCTHWLERDMPVMIFPEGTRSTTEEMLPFKDGAFRLAIETRASVLPIAVHGTRRALPKHSWRFQSSRARVSVGEPISTEGMTLADVERLKQLAWDRITAMRATLSAAS